MANDDLDGLDESPEREQKTDIATTLELLRQSEDDTLDARIFYGLSDLTASDVAQLQAVWELLLVEHRRKVMHRLVDISETNLELDYHEMGLFALRDEDAEVRETAIEVLWDDESLVLMNRLIELAQWDEAVQVRAAATGALGQFIMLGELGELPTSETNRAQDVVVSLLVDDSEDVEVRRRALEAVANSSHEIVDEAILEAYQGTDERMRASAVFAMGRTADSQWEEIVLREIDSPHPEMRYEAARASGELEIAEAVPMLGRLANNDDREIKEVAIWALGEIGGSGALRLLGRLADEAEEDEDADLLEAIEDAIGNASLAGAGLDLD